MPTVRISLPLRCKERMKSGPQLPGASLTQLILIEDVGCTETQDSEK
jgi:hypothetical protein